MTISTRRALGLATGLGLLAGSAAAQDLCGGIGANGQWIGGGEANSDISTADSYREQMALVLSGNEYVSLFSVSAPTTVRVEAAGRGNGDPLIDLLDSSGNVLLSDDDSGGNGAARAETPLGPGTYCMSLVSYDGAPMTAFVRIGRPEHEPLTEGGAVEPTTAQANPDGPLTVTPPSDTSSSCADASSLGTLDGPLTGTGSVTANRFWSFTLAQPAAVSITATNESADPVLTLYDGAETYLAENDDFDGLNSRIDMTSALPAGEYCIEVAALSDENLPIDIVVDTYDPEAALAGLYARGEAAPPLDGSYPVTDLGALSNRLRQDSNLTDQTSWFAIEVDQSGLVLIEAIAAGGNGDPWLIMFDDLGREVAQNDDYGDGLDAQLTARVTPGTYLVGAKQVGAGTQGFVRLLFERYIPAP